MKLLILMAVFLTGCFSTGYEVKKVETVIEVKGQVGDKKVGLNDKKEIILQEEVDASDELRSQQDVNLKLRDEYDHEAFMLKQCRTDLSDRRLGGSGEIPAINEVDGMKSIETVREEIGITDSGELKVVRKSYFVDQLKLERKYDSSLRKMTKLVVRHREECEYKMGIARRKAGLPSSRYMGRGYYTQGGEWVQTNPNENNLDDAFEMQAKAKAAKGGEE
jgi:hypothetical protein